MGRSSRIFMASADLEASVAQGVNPRQKGEGLRSQHQGNADVNTQQQCEAAFTQHQPPEMQTVFKGETSRHP